MAGVFWALAFVACGIDLPQYLLQDNGEKIFLMDRFNIQWKKSIVSPFTNTKKDKEEPTL